MLTYFKNKQVLGDTDHWDTESGARRHSMFEDSSAGGRSGEGRGSAAAVKAQIKAAASLHLKEGGEEDDSDSDHDALDPSEVKKKRRPFFIFF